MAKTKDEVTSRGKFIKFNIFSAYGNEAVTAPYRMTLDEAMRYFKANAIGGIE